ncbi:manganese efflux pump MntP family protein [Dialister sp.]|jgi:manganese efflux pump family protein|uniref:manganese efflux pump MntP n=1 Tax=Dialister sp. TaxID=1955814 RepID=UPI003A5C62E6
MNFLFLVNSVLLGVGLAMDAFSVSLANGIHEPSMKWKKMGIIAGTFGFFQFIMPLIGWACVNWIIDIFQSVLPYIPWISLILLLTLGILMVKDGLLGQEEEVCPETNFKCLLIQGLATSMDALSVGFTIASYDGGMAVAASFIIGIVTFFICLLGIILGRRFGMCLADKATIVGGIILMGIGLEIFLS